MDTTVRQGLTSVSYLLDCWRFVECWNVRLLEIQWYYISAFQRFVESVRAIFNYVDLLVENVKTMF